MAEVERIPYSTSVKKHVLLIGSTGQGKTTIANMLQNNGYTKEACLHPDTVGHGARSSTKKPKFSVVPDRNLIMLDTVGLGDAEMSNEEIISQLKSISTSTQLGVTSIVFVAKFKRWSRAELVNMRVVDAMFEGAWKEHSILVLTHYEGEVGDKEEETERWSQNDPDVKAALASFSRIIVTDNNVRRSEEACRPLRQKCLQELNEAIASMDAPIAVKPKLFKETLKLLFDSYCSVFANVKPRTKTTFESMSFIVQIGQVSCSISGGPCSICLEDISLEAMTITNCRHTFHPTCFDMSCRKFPPGEPPTCPNCRAPIRTIYVNGPVEK